MHDKADDGSSDVPGAKQGYDFYFLMRASDTPINGIDDDGAAILVILEVWRNSISTFIEVLVIMMTPKLLSFASKMKDFQTLRYCHE